MEESKLESYPYQFCSQPLENSLNSQPPPPKKQNLNLEFKQHDKIRIEEEEKDEIKEVITVPSIQPLNVKPTNGIPLPRSTIKQIRTLYQKFNPKQISSSEKQSFLPYEGIFRALNLWEFLNLDFESDIRSDLIVELICTYDVLEYCGFVRGFKICVGKFELADALKVPVEKNETLESIYRNDETKDVILKFLSGFVFLDDEEEDDDMCIMSEEAIQAIKLVQNGTANVVDWCGLIWGLVVKDMVDACTSGYSKFAPYLHCLIKAQCPNLLLEDVYVLELMSRLDVLDSTDSVESSSKEEEFDDENENDQGTKFSLGNNVNVDLMNDVNWNDSNEGFQFGLGRCNSNNAKNMEIEIFCKEQNGFSNFESLNSRYLLHSFSPQMNLLDQNVGPSSSNFFDGNITKGKRHVNADDPEYYYDHNNNQQKRMRIGTHWEEEEERPQSEFDSYMEQMQSMIGKAKMLYVEKEQECVDAHMQIQCLNEMLKQKDELINNLQKRRKETEKMKFEKEEKMKRIVEDMVSAFERVWLVKFDEYNKLILLNGTRLAKLEEKVKRVRKELLEEKVKRVKERIAECKRNEGEQT